MTFLPIVERELRTQARQRSTFRHRQMGALVGFVGLLWLLLTTDLSSGDGGRWAFGILGALTLGYCLLQGARHTADSISGEKRAGTLGLLFLTDLRGHDVVLGKMAACSLGSSYGALGILPVLGMPLILGGVTGAEFWRLVLLLILTLAATLSAGMLGSTLTRREGAAWLITFGISLALSAAPITAFVYLFEDNYAKTPRGYWWALLPLPAASVVMLALASLTLPRLWRDEPGRGRTSKPRPAPPIRPGETPGSSRGRERRVQGNPVAWLAHGGAVQSRMAWLLVAVPMLVTALVCAKGWTPLAVSWATGLGVAVHFVLLSWVAWRACYQVGEGARSGALELLLTTPLTAEQILLGQWEALRRTFQGPVLLLAGCELSYFFAFALASRDPGSSLVGLVSLLLALGMAISDYFAVANYGMWIALRTRRPGAAAMRTVLFVVVIPLLASLFSIFCACVLPFTWLVKNALFLSIAREKLRHHFRDMVSGQYESKSATWSAGGWPWSRKRSTDLPPVLK
jgi:hypothetical protein